MVWFARNNIAASQMAGSCSWRAFRHQDDSVGSLGRRNRCVTSSSPEPSVALHRLPAWTVGRTLVEVPPAAQTMRPLCWAAGRRRRREPERHRLPAPRTTPSPTLWCSKQDHDSHRPHSRLQAFQGGGIPPAGACRARWSQQYGQDYDAPRRSRHGPPPCDGGGKSMAPACVGSIEEYRRVSTEQMWCHVPCPTGAHRLRDKPFQPFPCATSICFGGIEGTNGGRQNRDRTPA